MKDENFEIDLDAIKASIKALKREAVSVSKNFVVKMLSELMKTSDEHDSFLEGSTINGVQIQGLWKIFDDANAQYSKLISEAEKDYNTYKSADTGGAPEDYSGGVATVSTIGGSIFPSGGNSSSGEDIKTGFTNNDARIQREKEIAEQKEQERKAREEEERLQEEAKKEREAKEEQELREQTERKNAEAEAEERRRAEEAKQQEQNNTSGSTSKETVDKTSSLQTSSTSSNNTTNNNNSSSTNTNNNSNKNNLGNTSKPSKPVNQSGTGSSGSENYHTGGGYSSNSGYTSSIETLDDTVIDTANSTDSPIDVLGDAPTSIDEIIKNNYTKIPTSEEPILSSKSKGKSTLIPVIAGLSAAAAAGIGAKAYLDRKENNENEKSDGIETEDWSGEDTLDLEYDDNKIPVAFLDDDDDDEESTNPEKYGAKNIEELADLH